MPTTRSGRESNPEVPSASKTKSARPRRLSSPHKAKKASGGALAASNRRRSRIMSTEAKHEWTHQYYQGLDVNDFPELESEAVPSSAVKADFISPFEGEGTFEVVAGKEGPGSGAVRLSRVKDGHSDTFIVPIRHIEQAIVVARRTEDGPFTMIVVPTAAVGASSVTKKYPKIIRLHWPCSEPGKPLPKAPEGQTPVLKTIENILNEQLAPQSKKVILHVDKTPAPADQPVFKCFAQLKSVPDSYIERGEGSLFFLPMGILWLGESTIYLSIKSLSRGLLTFARDAASKTAPNPPWPIVAMGLFLPVSAPFYNATDKDDDGTILEFQDIENYSSVKDKIISYFGEHNVQLDQVEQHFYNYKEDEPMSGFGPLMED
ncbi:hypothetical protein NW767_005147 [Fusarium falciforme]|uniref:Uncharacterized protein n=1 Tax=Fusarium falciforme TaxID=195108 RepID=A0A9W8RHK8_9HYPO|nr:hypothetical protein NW755_001238 [Fusarium falciforme]KAJ4203657.1 hypothetical protein NW767_005147 [Fusarium falciforme]KAJ4252187.1 hypothetical protein NW757_006309 [Fusarium falciforme]